MKKLIFSILFIGLIVPLAAKADMVSDLQAQINALLQQIQALQAQLAAQQTTTPTITTAPTSCPNLTYNLYLGLSDSQTGGQVSALQRFLAQDSSIYPEGLITGYFGPATERAVQRWQANSGIVTSGTPDTTGYGVVGPQTRAAISRSCEVVKPSVTVVSPKSGEKWAWGNTYTISWESKNAPAGAWVWVGDLRYYAGKNYYEPFFNKDYKGPASGSVQYQVSQNKLTGNVSVGVILYPSNVDPNEIDPIADEARQLARYFVYGIEIVSSTPTNQPPVIDSVSGPSTLNVGQLGTWTIRAHDPENNQMSYSVNWGDEAVGMGAPTMVPTTPSAQTVTLAHSYSSAGIYNPTFTISDSAGLSAQTSISVNVGGVVVAAPALTISVSSVRPSQNVGAGSRDFDFGHFILDATASGEDVSIKQIPLAYAAVGGAITNLTNCRLFDGSTALTTGANIVNPFFGSNTVFNLDSPLIVFKGTSKQITLKCDVSAAAPQNSTYKWGPKTFIATGVSSGASFTVNLGGNTWGPTMTVKTGGLEVYLDVQSPGYRIVAAGSNNVELSRIKFSALASGEDIELKQIALQLSDVGLNTPDDLRGREVTLWDTSGNQVSRAVFPTGDNTTSSIISNFIIPRGSSKTMIVKGSIGNINSVVGPLLANGDLLKVDYDGNNNGTSGNYGVGRTSGSTIIPSSPDTASAGVRIMKSYPSFAYIPLSSTQKALRSGTEVSKPLYRFSIQANAAGDVSVYKLTFDIYKSERLLLSDYKLYVYTDSGFSVIASPSTGGVVSSRIVQSGVSEVEIYLPLLNAPAGVTRYFSLTATVSGAVSGDGITDTISTKLLGDGNYPNVVPLMIPADTVDAYPDDNFIWSPMLSSNTTLSASDWTNGYFLPGLPASGMASETLSEVETATPTPTPSITVLSPNGGEQWEVGKTYQIKWQASSLDKVSILLLSGKDKITYKVLTVASDINVVEGSYSWTIPETTIIKSLQDSPRLYDYPYHLIEVVDSRYGYNSTIPIKYYDDSNAPFSIVSAPIFNISLKQGWNLISLPYEPVNPAIEKVLESINGKYSLVQSFDEKGGHTYNPALASSFSDLKEMRSGYGYQIKMTQDAVLAIQGTVSSSILPTLRTGLNWIGVSSANSQNISSLVDTTKITTLYTITPGSAAVSEEGQPHWPQNFTQFEPGKGYILKLSGSSSVFDASLNQMAGVLEGMKEILENLRNLLK